MAKIAGHTITDRQLYALHGLYRGLLDTGGGRCTIYGASVRTQLATLADKGVIARTGMGAYMIPYGSPGAAIVAATPDYAMSDHL